MLYCCMFVFLPFHLFASACISLVLDKVRGIGAYPCSLFFLFSKCAVRESKEYLNGFKSAITFNSFNVYE